MPGTYISPAETGLYYLQSRYYDPEIGRFINPDTFASTGQGFTGNNMFAYCNNNPTNYTDSLGMLPAPNTRYYNDGGRMEIQELLYIKDQNASPVCSKKLGLVTVSHGGCGAVATYNALVTLGDYTSFDSVLNYYNDSPLDLNLLGALGMLPHVVADYFKNAGYSVFVTDDRDGIDIYSQSADAAIMFYVFPQAYDLFGLFPIQVPFAHFVSYRRTEDGYIGYNTGSPSGTNQFTFPSDFAYQGQRLYAVGIFIYK